MEIFRYPNFFLTEVETFAQLFSSEFVTSSWYDLLSFLNWDPNETLCSQCEPVRDCRGRVYALNPDERLENTKDIEKADMFAPLVLTKEMDLSSGRETSFTATSLFLPVS